LCFSIALNIFLLGFATGQLRSRSIEPWLVMPHRARATAGYAMAQAGRSRPLASRAMAPAASSLSHHEAGKPRPAAASRATTKTGCTLAAVGRALAAARLWLAAAGCTKAVAG
jgi:hypothetical protein